MTYAQTDSIYVTVQGDTATIWHTQTWRNCASLFMMDVQLTDYQITVMEVDTVGPIANCNCYFDLSVTIGPLEPGDYTVDIFSTDTIYGDTIYWGSTSFTINSSGQQDSSLVISEYQSDCYQLSIRDFDNLKLINFLLHPNYPNPFNPRTTVVFSIPISGLVNLTVYDVLGRKLETLVNEVMPVGTHSITWDGSRVPSGIYFIKLTNRNFSQTKKALLLK